MHARRLIIVGDSLFADTLERILSDSSQVQVIGTASTLAAALERIAETVPEAVIVAGVQDPPCNHWGQLLVRFPDIPLVRADLATDRLLLITCQSICARPDALLTALAGLPNKTLQVEG